MLINDVTLNTTNVKHLGKEFNLKATDDPMPSFSQALSQAFNKVNGLETKAENLQIKMVTDPDSVNAHDVSIAQTKAELALSFTKSIATRVINTFNELTNLK